MCLSWIPVHGLDGANIPIGCNSITFSADPPPLEMHDEAFAVPVQFNYPHVDAIYWRFLTDRLSDKPKVLIVGLQLTLQHWRAHSQAEIPFLSKAMEWVDECNWDAEYGMAWLVESRHPGDKQKEKIEAETTEKHRERMEKDPKRTSASPAPKFTRYIYEIKEFADRIGRKLAFARNKPFGEPAPKRKPIGRKRKPSGYSTDPDTHSNGNSDDEDPSYQQPPGKRQKRLTDKAIAAPKPRARTTTRFTSLKSTGSNSKGSKSTSSTKAAGEAAPSTSGATKKADPAPSRNTKNSLKTREQKLD
jgi:hypothetical protein